VMVNVPSALWKSATVPVALPSTLWNVPLLTGAAALGEALCSIIADADGDGLCSIIADGLGVGGALVAAAVHPVRARKADRPIDPSMSGVRRRRCMD
jgi:hypothetical protein